jgi:arrestin-related trafficking adapter 4/5/7
MGGASVAYKLRAHVGRSGLSPNLQAVAPVYITRSFSAEALEYQQTLDIESSLSDKLMYSIMIPHKAWAIGDNLSALFKFSPLAKGIQIVKITTTIDETTKVHAHPNSKKKQYNHVVAKVTHDIINGIAIPRTAVPSQCLPTLTSWDSSSTLNWLEPSPIIPTGQSSTPLASVSGYPNGGSTEDLETDHDIIARVSFTIPSTTSPSHRLAPMTITHRIRWNVTIDHNGNSSELRCTLPVHILDSCLLDEARGYTAAAHRLLFGDSKVRPEDEGQMDLPSYTAHIRDRVANVYLHDAAAMHFENPWIHAGYSPTLGTSPSGDDGHVPATPQSDWIGSELSLSQGSSVLSSSTHDRQSRPTSQPLGPPEGNQLSRRHRFMDRSPSPEASGSTNTSLANLPVAGPNETYVHNGTHANRRLPSLFQISLKPFTNVVSQAWRHTSLTSLGSTLQSHRNNHRNYSQGTRPVIVPMTDREIGTGLLHRAFTEVPDYGVAARGFIGGVPPLSSMHGLPSYAETESNLTGGATSTVRCVPQSQHLPVIVGTVT